METEYIEGLTSKKQNLNGNKMGQGGHFSNQNQNHNQTRKAAVQVQEVQQQTSPPSAFTRPLFSGKKRNNQQNSAGRSTNDAPTQSTEMP